MSFKICKYCHKPNLHWNFNHTNNKWELLDANNNKHQCFPNSISRPASRPIPNNRLKNFYNDPLIYKALQKFKLQLSKYKNNRYV